MENSRETLPFWRQRLYRNSYTRSGQTHHVAHWCVKIQHAGRRQTWSLSATSREAAAREARQRYLELTTPSPSRTVPGKSLRLVRRPYSAPGEYSLCWESVTGYSYFPLGTADPAVAGRRGRKLQGRLIQEGGQIQQQVARELTLALEWSANPVLWTYFTLNTIPERIPFPKAERPPLPPRNLSAIVVLEPDPSLRIALISTLNRQSEFYCTAAFSNVPEALSELSRTGADLVLVNHSLDGLSGAGFLDRLHRLTPEIPGLIYTPYHDSDRLFASTPGGATAYLLKRTSPERFLEPLSAGTTIGPGDQAGLVRRAQAWFQRVLGTPAPAGITGELARLTNRELEILALLSKGFLDKEIAQSLRISVWTVHGHAKKIYEKLGVHSRTEAAVKYLQK